MLHRWLSEFGKYEIVTYKEAIYVCKIKTDRQKNSHLFSFFHLLSSQIYILLHEQKVLKEGVAEVMRAFLISDLNADSDSVASVKVLKTFNKDQYKLYLKSVMKEGRMMQKVGLGEKYLALKEESLHGKPGWN